jgi:3-dehydroquinate synthase
MNNYKKVNVSLPNRSYPIYIGQDIYPLLPDLLKGIKIGKQIAIISTPPVSSLYLDKVFEAIGLHWKVYHYDVPDGEKSKSLDMANALYTWLIGNNFERNSTIITLGGGVVGDLAGFVAATFLRGVNLIHCPTSLLAQVDSSIGGKVGINHNLGKNLIGAFYQPRLVLIDISVLKTLPQEEFICGLGEVIKYGIIKDVDLFELIDTKLEQIIKKEFSILEEIVQRCTQQKADIVEQDEKESGIRSVLNLGHTFGHALETLYDYHTLKHGQAVLLGIKCALSASQDLNIIDSKVAEKISTFIDRIGIELPLDRKIPDPNDLYSLMKTDKKVRSGRINLILIEDIGRVCQREIDDKALIINSYKSILP